MRQLRNTLWRRIRAIKERPPWLPLTASELRMGHYALHIKNVGPFFANDGHQTLKVIANMTPMQQPPEGVLLLLIFFLSENTI